MLLFSEVHSSGIIIGGPGAAKKKFFLSNKKIRNFYTYIKQYGI